MRKAASVALSSLYLSITSPIPLPYSTLLSSDAYFEGTPLSRLLLERSCYMWGRCRLCHLWSRALEVKKKEEDFQGGSLEIGKGIGG